MHFTACVVTVKCLGENRSKKKKKKKKKEKVCEVVRCGGWSCELGARVGTTTWLVSVSLQVRMGLTVKESPFLRALRDISGQDETKVRDVVAGMAVEAIRMSSVLGFTVANVRLAALYAMCGVPVPSNGQYGGFAASALRINHGDTDASLVGDEIIDYPAAMPSMQAIVGAFDLFPAILSHTQTECMYRSTVSTSHLFGAIAVQSAQLIAAHAPCIGRDAFTRMLCRMIRLSSHVVRGAGGSVAYQWPQRTTLCIARSDYMLDARCQAKGRWKSEEDHDVGGQEKVVCVEYNTISVGLAHLSDVCYDRAGVTLQSLGTVLQGSSAGVWTPARSELPPGYSGTKMQGSLTVKSGGAGESATFNLLAGTSVDTSCQLVMDAVDAYQTSVGTSSELSAHPPVVLFLVTPDEANMSDHTGLEHRLRRRGCVTLRRTYAELACDVAIAQALRQRRGDVEACTEGCDGVALGQKLRVHAPEYRIGNIGGMKSGESTDGSVEIAVVYARAGYSPDHYITKVESLAPHVSEHTLEAFRRVGAFLAEDDAGGVVAAEWVVRHVMECSVAIKCPNASLQLTGSKRVQAILSMSAREGSGIVSSGLPQSSEFAAVSAEQYPLSLEDFEGPDAERRGKRQAVIDEVLSHPDDWVLKPLREGGANNFFGQEIAPKLSALVDADNGASDDTVSADDEENLDGYVVMRLIDGELVESYSVGSVVASRPPVTETAAATVLPRVAKAPANAEFGVFAGFLASQPDATIDATGNVVIGEIDEHVAVRLGSVLVRSKGVGDKEAGFLAGSGAVGAVCVRA